jgi:DNA modification methylase
MRINANSKPSTTSLKGRLPTNTLSHNHRVQRWGNFIAGYSVEFVENCLEERDSTTDTVIDPFLGCGTTLVTARNMGFCGVGYDRHPVFYTLAKAKLSNYNLEDLDHIRHELLHNKSSLYWTEDVLKFLSKLFSEADLTDIKRASDAANNIDERIRPLAIAFFLKSCEAACGAQTDGVYKAPTSTKKKIPFVNAVEKVYLMFKEDIDCEWYREHWVNQVEATCYNKSSVEIDEIEDESIGICITSPPYLNNFDYAEMTRMHLYLLGWAGSWGEISTSIRNHLITNTTTALKGKKTVEQQDNNRGSLPEDLIAELDRIVENLAAERKVRAGKKEYNYMIFPYYSEIRKVLYKLFHVLKDGGEVHWVVADAALYGVHIKTHLHTAELMKNIGFSDVSVELIRKRGHRWILDKRDGAKEGLGEYHIRAYKRL